MVYTNHLFLIWGRGKLLLSEHSKLQKRSRICTSELPDAQSSGILCGLRKAWVANGPLMVRLMSSSSHLIAIHYGLTMNYNYQLIQC